MFLLFRHFSFLLRGNFMPGVDCHAHADQRAASKILVSLHQFLAARVEASCHADKCHRVTDIYVLSFCVSSSLSVVIIRPISSMESELPVFLNSLTIIDSTNTGQLYVLLDDEKVAACVIANDEKVDGYLDAPWQIDSDE